MNTGIENTAIVEMVDGNYEVHTPSYDRDIVATCKKLNGKWNESSYRWTIPANGFAKKRLDVIRVISVQKNWNLVWTI
jgi:hypothetical protein